jgi:putative hydrolase of the HAD superfamily
MGTNWFKKVVHDDKAKLKAAQDLFALSDLGKITRAELVQEASRITGVPVDEIEPGIEAEKILDTSLVEYAKELKTRGYRLACLSNGSHEWTLRVINDHTIGHLFDEVVLSGDLGIVKPDHKIYKYTLDKLNVDTEQTVFVDDRQINVDAAQECGMTGVLFTDTVTFINDFEKLAQQNI